MEECPILEITFKADNMNMYQLGSWPFTRCLSVLEKKRHVLGNWGQGAVLY